MKRQSFQRIYYVIYPPNYKPGDGFVFRKNYKAALRQARKYGIGSTVSRWVEVQHTPTRHLGLFAYWSTSHHVYVHG